MITTTDAEAATAFLTELQRSLAIGQAILNAALPDSGEDGIRIRLPDDIDYHTVLADLTRIFKALEQVLLDPEMGGEIRLVGWENGSLWIEVAVGSAALAAFIGSIAWSAAVVRRKWAEAQIMIDTARKVGAEADVVEKLAAASKTAIDAVIEVEAKNVLSQHGKGKLGADYLERLKFSIREWYELISRGAEVHPALMEPSKAAELFPDFSKLNTIASKVLQIEGTPAPQPPSENSDSAGTA